MEKYISLKRTVIVDLSWPKGHVVNDGINANIFFGTNSIFTFPIIDNVTAQVINTGSGCQIFKIDVSTYIKHIPFDPGDINLTSLDWQGIYMDKFL